MASSVRRPLLWHPSPPELVPRSPPRAVPASPPALAPASSVPPLPDVEAEQPEAGAADGDQGATVTADHEAGDHQGGAHDRGGLAIPGAHAGGGGVYRERRLVFGREAQVG